MNILIPTNCKGGENIPEMFPSSHLKLPHSFFQVVIMNQPQIWCHLLSLTKACLLQKPVCYFLENPAGSGQSGRIRPLF